MLEHYAVNVGCLPDPALQEHIVGDMLVRQNSLLANQLVEFFACLFVVVHLLPNLVPEFVVRQRLNSVYDLTYQSFAAHLTRNQHWVIQVDP